MKDQIMQMTENPYDLKLKLVCGENVNRFHRYQLTGRTFPLSMEILPTNRCNLNCSWCIDKHYRNDDELEIGRLRRFLDEYASEGGKSVTWSGGGEPGIYPHITEAVIHAAKLGLDQGMMTNGTFSPELVPVIGKYMIWVRISLDTADANLYTKLKGVNMLPRVENNVRELSKHPVKVNINVNVNELNREDVFKTAAKAKEWGADVFQLRPVLPCPAEKKGYMKMSLQTADKLKNVLQDDRFFISVSYDKFEEIAKPRTYDSCRYHNFIFILNANGDLCVCAYRLYEDDFTFGNIYRNTLKEIWESEKWNDVVRNTTNMDFSKCQVCCKGHELNKFLHALRITNGLRDRRFL